MQSDANVHGHTGVVLDDADGGVVDERFDVGKKKDDGAFAASLVTRMLWYLEPTGFSWLKGEENGSIILALYAKIFVPPPILRKFWDSRPSLDSLPF